ncbi:IS1182 family transposase [Streptomyces sp. NBC_01264]|nr:IS1182 family transposase [Streptomyces sp. NBC_01264]MCX4784231.1 IS1182 family transposase [Streptomyces sp. NBC_01264]MCX4784441.1 IS1182 family transposase [Streptomyces sp. NBC_01264]MCX4784536.1 IS1182 family transposase [Streptomyces sp. NBC_01264]MCX4784550.1 IS1182 family transposase [Streptomyces sp. NBC_01264]
MRVRDELGGLFADAEFAGAFGLRGRRGWSPGRLAMVTVLQMAENLTDRAAAHRVRFDLSWKYCLGLELEDVGFDASVLSEFRTRVVEHGLEERVLDLLLAALKGKGLVKAGGKQRTDSTHVLAAVRDLNRLELCGESVRAALEALSAAAPHWVAQAVDVRGWNRRYGRRIDESWRPASSKAKRDELVLDYGRDAVALLRAVHNPHSPLWLRELPAVQVLRRITVQNYLVTTGGDGREVVKRREADKEGLPPGRLRLASPYDLDARNGTKNALHWTGYKLHISEVCQRPRPGGGTPRPGRRARPDIPNVITHVATTDATVPDVKLVEPVHRALADRGLLPAEHYLDSGYASAELLAGARAAFGITLVAPLLAGTSRQDRENAGYQREAFTIDWDAEQATCPQGATSRFWSPARQHGREGIAVRFDEADCGPCPVRAACTDATRQGRQLTLRPRDLQELINTNHAAQQDADWQTTYALRAGVEGTIRQATAVTGNRRARYRGLAKTHLEHVYSAVALNLIRLDAWWNNQPLDHTRTSHLARLDLTLTA